MRAQIRNMLVLQDKMNTKIHPEWRTQGYEYYRAAWTECAELMDHQGWKWWKKQVPDVSQVHLEIVDIWHFGLSMMIRDGPALDLDKLANHIEDAFIEEPINQDVSVVRMAELMAANLIIFQVFSIGAFRDLYTKAGMTFDDLYRMYIAKNVLNFFRQDHGYKTGEYKKQWLDGREDNEHLAEIMASLDSTSPDYADNIYSQLLTRY
jgi:dimeric dUTPase (all-alpha-NTP-PPase superfamily)